MGKLLLLLTGMTFYMHSLHAQAAVAKKSDRDAAVKPVTSYNISSLTGKWQETTRRNDTTKKKISFTDTLQLNFNKRDSVIVRDGSSVSLRGYAGIEKLNQLHVAGYNFTILSLNKSTLILNDGIFSRQFVRKNKFYHETLGTTVIPKENLSEPVTVSLKNVTGKWDVYRTQAIPGAAEDSSIIKSITISNANEDGSHSGEVTFMKAGQSVSLPLKVIFDKGSMSLETMYDTWQLQTYKADGKEFIFGHQGGLVYFTKHLN